MSVYKISGSGSGSDQNSISAIDIQFDGEIVAASLEIIPEAALADGDSIQAEISFLSTHTIAANDARGSIIEVGFRNNFNTQGGEQGSARGEITGIRLPVVAGERVHLHASSSAGAASVLTGYLYVNDSTDPRLRRRR